ncbi:hypothetical protein LMIY3S_02015 [Labrys miyagiensis]
MMRLIAIPALAAVLSITAIADANAGSWRRSGSVTGPRGTTNWGSSGSCTGGSCSWQGGGTGFRGNSWSRQGEGTCGGGSCNWNGEFTGPRGNTRTYGGTIYR